MHYLFLMLGHANEIGRQHRKHVCLKEGYQYFKAVHEDDECQTHEIHDETEEISYLPHDEDDRRQ